MYTFGTLRKRFKQAPWLAGLLLILAACAPQAGAATVTPTSATALASATPSPAPTATATPEPRREPITYVVAEGDTIASIAAQFGLQPETILWTNRAELGGYPDYLLAGMPLLILPVDGVYHQVGGGDTLANVAAAFGAEVQAIVDWPGNGLSSSDDALATGQWLMVPGGRRQLGFRPMPNVPRAAAALAQAEFGRGACPNNINSAWSGDGQYAWPVAARSLAGDPFADWHTGADLAIEPGEAVLAADDGVVTFAGWSNLGYGLTVMLDHGNGNYTLYGGLGEVSAVCGQELAQGETLGLGGITGHPAGPLLHFEIRRADEFMDPFSVLPND